VLRCVYSYKSMQNFFGDIRAVYNFYRDETAKKGKPRIGEWFVKWERVAPPKPIEEEQPHFSASITSAIVNKAKTQMERALYAMAGGNAGRGGELFGLHVEDVREQSNGTGIVCIRRSVFAGRENTTKSDKVRTVLLNASVMAEIKKHLGERTSGYVFQTRNGTALLLSNVLEDSLHPILDELGIPRTGMHAFRRRRISEWVYSGVSRQVIRDWAGHGSDKLIDLYTKKMWQYHSPEMAKVKPLLDSNWTQDRGVNPLDGTNYLDTVSAFLKAFLHLLAGEGVWGRGRHLSPFPQKSFRNLSAVLFVLKEHHRCASRFGRT
jgi:integrase